MSWPNVIFEAPLLRGLDARGRHEIERAGTLRAVQAEDALYRAGEMGTSLYVVATGEVALFGTVRGETEARLLRRAGPGDSFGEEASIGASFRAHALVKKAGTVAEIPMAMLRRALGRAGAGAVAERIERRLRRRATAELFATLAFTAQLSEHERELLLDAAEHRPFERGQAIYRQGDPPLYLWLVADGMVQLQVSDGERNHVRAYLGHGDFFGDEEVVAGVPRASAAIASGPSLLVAIPAAAARTVADRQPRLLRRLRRVTAPDRAGAAVAGATQHAFTDLYRLSVARSLLVIDLDSCVRCGHCSSRCASLHGGVARLVRRGDVVVTRMAEDAEASPLLLPSSCQHCEHPACMVDCPTGAIGRDPEGEVHIKESLCTGCGACVKACPWDNVQLVARPPKVAGDHELLAVKCDLCRGYEAPACVEACPTNAIARLDPAADLPDVGNLLRRSHEPTRLRNHRGDFLLSWATPFTIVAVALAAGLRSGRGFSAASGIGWALGLVATAAFLALLAYAFPKRIFRPKRRARGRERATTFVRSRLAPQLRIHLALGGLAAAAAVGHGGFALFSSGGALSVALLSCVGLGLLGASSYGLLPQRLSRLERRAALPEDLPAQAQRLHDRLYAAVTGRSEVVKKLFERVIVPYLRQPLGALATIASGRDLVAERARLKQRIETVLAGRASERLGGIDELVRLAVELRALRAQRILSAILRGWLPLHVAAAAIATILLVVHILGAS